MDMNDHGSAELVCEEPECSVERIDHNHNPNSGNQYSIIK